VYYIFVDPFLALNVFYYPKKGSK